MEVFLKCVHMAEIGTPKEMIYLGLPRFCYTYKKFINTSFGMKRFPAILHCPNECIKMMLFLLMVITHILQLLRTAWARVSFWSPLLARHATMFFGFVFPRQDLDSEIGIANFSLSGL